MVWGFFLFLFFFSTPVCGIVGMSGEVAGYLVNAKCLYQLDGGLIEELENDKYPTLSGALNHSIPLKPESVLPLRYAGSPCCFLSQPHRDCMLVVKLHAGAVKPQVQAWFSNFKAPTTSPWVFRGKGCSKHLCWSSLDVFFFFFFFFCETIEPRQKKNLSKLLGSIEEQQRKF